MIAPVKIFLSILLLFVIIILALKYLFMPWVWILLLLLITSIFVIKITRKKSLKLLTIYLLAVFSALLTVEIYLYSKIAPQNIVSSGTYVTEGFTTKNNVLGYAPEKE